MATPTGTLTDLLSRYGVDYPNAPGPTPALLAFMRGLGMTLDEADELRASARDRIRRRATDAQADVTRAAGRSKENVTADLIRRGVLRSGEANTRYARHAEDVAAARSDIALGEAEGLDAVEQAFQQTRGGLRTRALETVLNTETAEDARRATAAAQSAAFEREEQARVTQFEREREAQENYWRKQEELMRKYGAL